MALDATKASHPSFDWSHLLRILRLVSRKYTVFLTFIGKEKHIRNLYVRCYVSNFSLEFSILRFTATNVQLLQVK